jgi:hypothetical protein
MEDIAKDVSQEDMEDIIDDDLDWFDGFQLLGLAQPRLALLNAENELPIPLKDERDEVAISAASPIKEKAAIQETKKEQPMASSGSKRNVAEDVPQPDGPKKPKTIKQEPGQPLVMTEARKKLYAEYAPPSRDSLLSSRKKIGDDAHAWMVAKLHAWQAENGKDEHERPSEKIWYLDARVECIKNEKITKDSCEDVVKSYLKSYVHTTLKQAKFKKDNVDGIDVD